MSATNKNNEAVRVVSPSRGSSRYLVAQTTNLLEPVAGTYVTKAALQGLIVRGVRVTIRNKS